jgi:FHS family L-fucose permease-like MFS transporter
MMILLFGMISFVTNLAAPMGIVVKGQFHASNFLGMLGNFANFAAYACMGIPAGFLLQRIGYKKTALTAIAVGFTGVAIQFLSGVLGSFGVYLAGAFVAGFSMCMLNTVVNPMLNTLGGGGNKGNQLIQIGGSFNSFMGTLVPILVGMLVGQVTSATAIADVNPVMFIALAIFAVVGLTLTFVTIPEPHIQKPSPHHHLVAPDQHTVNATTDPSGIPSSTLPTKGSLFHGFFRGSSRTAPAHDPATSSKRPIHPTHKHPTQYDFPTDIPLPTAYGPRYTAWSFRHFVLGAIGIFVYVGVEVGIPGTLNLYLTEALDKGGQGLLPALAGSVAATYWFLMLVGRFIGAAIAAKVSPKAMLTTASAAALILTALAIFLPTSIPISMPVFQSSTSGLSFGLALVPINAFCLVLIGLCTSVMWGGIFNLAVEGLGKYVTAASGIFMMMVCGGGILPLLQNKIADLAGFLPSYWVIFAGLAYLLFYALVGSENVNEDIPID